MEGWLWGRGATDMKSGVAAFAAAAVDFVQTTPPDGAVILAITGDEEGEAKDGTRALLDWMAAQGEAMSVCLVGEPTCPERLGDAMKIGRRGSLTAHVVAQGVQGHSAYPHRAKNPLTALVRLLDRLASTELDTGTDHFDPSTLAIVTVDTGNPATNVIPSQARAAVNIRFNDSHSGASLSHWLQTEGQRVTTETGVTFDWRIGISGESFLTPPGALSALVGRAVQGRDGDRPGTVDQRRHVGCALRQGSLPGGGIRSGRQDDAPGGRAGGGGADPCAQGDLRAYPAGLLRMIQSIAVTRDLATCLAIRRKVFIDEQGVSEADEVDGLDPVALHLLAMQDAAPVGTARILVEGAVGKIGRVCVLAPGARDGSWRGADPRGGGRVAGDARRREGQARRAGTRARLL